MTEDNKVLNFSIDEIIDNAVIDNCNPPIYANHIRFSAGGNELEMDFYLISPSQKEEAPKAHLVQKVMIPLAAAKGTASAIANVVVNLEQAAGIEIPDQRGKMPGDVVEIWK